MRRRSIGPALLIKHATFGHALKPHWLIIFLFFAFWPIRWSLAYIAWKRSPISLSYPLSLYLNLLVLKLCRRFWSFGCPKIEDVYNSGFRKYLWENWIFPFSIFPFVKESVTNSNWLYWLFFFVFGEFWNSIWIVFRSLNCHIQLMWSWAKYRYFLN